MKLLKTNEVAERLSVSPHVIREARKQGKIPAIQINTRLFLYDWNKVQASLGISEESSQITNTQEKKNSEGCPRYIPKGPSRICDDGGIEYAVGEDENGNPIWPTWPTAEEIAAADAEMLNGVNDIPEISPGFDDDFDDEC